MVQIEKIEIDQALNKVLKTTICNRTKELKKALNRIN
jgi:hypothetical protein